MAPLGRSSLRVLALRALALTASLAASVPVRAAQSPRPAPSRTLPARAFPNSPEGLHELLTTLLSAAKSADPGRLDALVVSLEIPDHDQWFARTFGADRGASDADLYSRTLDQSENQFEKQIRQLAAQSGDFEVHKVNDAPHGAETQMLARFKQHVDVYFAGWKPKVNSARSDADAFPYPYFLFIDGKFRWDALQRIPAAGKSQFPAAPTISESNIPSRSSLPPAPPAGQPLYVPATPPPSQSPTQAPSQSPSPNEAAPAPPVDVPGKNGVGYPSCLSCPAPVYPASAKADGLEGDVVLQATIGADGHASNLTLVRTDALIFDEYAIAAVRDWRFRPATGPDGKPVPVLAQLQVQFRLTKSP